MTATSTTYTAIGQRWPTRPRSTNRLATSGNAIESRAPTATWKGSVGCGCFGGIAALGVHCVPSQ